MTDISKNAELQQSCITAVKSRFFAQYWGQEVGLFKKGNYSNPTGTLSIVDGSLITASNIESYSKTKIALQLKPISKITDEDLEFIYQNKKINVDIDEDVYLSKKLANFVESDIYLTDYLRSKGYALPFMEYSVDELISFGWVQLL